MTLFENPLYLSKQVSDLYAAVSLWQQRLHRGEIDDSGPFVGKPELTERDAFRVISELPDPEPVKLAWTRWAFRLTEARVNARLLANMAEAYRVERHQLEQPERFLCTLAELWQRALTRPSERSIWFSALGANSARLSFLVMEQPARQNEIARRAGFDSAATLVAPIAGMAEWAERLLLATDAIYRDLVPLEFAPWLDQALAVSAVRGWPAQLNPRSVQQLLGSREWFNGLSLPQRALPTPIAASSFARALYQLGAAIQLASAPVREPFVMALDPYGLYRHTVGSLCAQLVTSNMWQVSVLTLPRARAAEQARALLISQLISARSTALSVILWERARESATRARKDFEELCHRALGFALPKDLCGVIPRLRADAGQRLVSPWLAARWTRDLIAEFDEDWFRNPRGIEAVSDRISRVLPSSVDEAALSACLEAFVARLHEGL